MFKVAFAVALATAVQANSNASWYAYCEVKENKKSDSGVSGLLKIYQIGDGKMNIIGKIGGLNSNQKHGLHIHEEQVKPNGDCATTGKHFNPMGSMTHGAPYDSTDMRHVGDMANLAADENGVAVYRHNDYMASLDPESGCYVGNLSFTVHANQDDYGNAGTASSTAGGSSGARLACCNIMEVSFDEWAALEASSYLP